MAASTLPVPGTRLGPCLDPCKHTDCAETVAMALSVCPFCDEAINYGRRFYNDREHGLCHAVCLEDSLS